RGERGPVVPEVAVDLAGAERGIADECAAEIERPPHPQSKGLDGLGDELAEHALLGEVLRAHDHDVAWLPAGDEQRHDDDGPSHRGGLTRRSSAPSAMSAAIARA